MIANLMAGQQRALVDRQGRPADVRREALWQDSSEWRDAERAEKQRLLDQYKREWGREPA